MELNKKNAAAFLEAAKRGKEFGLPTEYEPVFIEAMKKFATYFEAHPDITMDVEKVFQERLYNNLKFKVDHDYLKSISASGEYKIKENLIILDSLKEGNTSENLHTLVHEFVHFIYMNTYEKQLITNEKARRNIPSSMNEAFTELTAAEIVGAQCHSYEALTSFVKILNETHPVGNSKTKVDCVPFLNGNIPNYFTQFSDFPKGNLLYTQILTVGGKVDPMALEFLMRQRPQYTTKEQIAFFSKTPFAEKIPEALFYNKVPKQYSKSLQEYSTPDFEIPEEYLKIAKEYVIFMQAYAELEKAYPKNYNNVKLKKVYSYTYTNYWDEEYKHDDRVYCFDAGNETFIFHYNNIVDSGLPSYTTIERLSHDKHEKTWIGGECYAEYNKNLGFYDLREREKKNNTLIQLTTDKDALYKKLEKALETHIPPFNTIYQNIEKGEYIISNDEDFIKLKCAEINLFHKNGREAETPLHDGIEVESYQNNYKPTVRPLALSEIKNLKKGEYIRVRNHGTSIEDTIAEFRIDEESGKLKIIVDNKKFCVSDKRRNKDYLRELYKLEKAYYDKHGKYPPSEGKAAKFISKRLTKDDSRNK